MLQRGILIPPAFNLLGVVYFNHVLQVVTQGITLDILRPRETVLLFRELYLTDAPLPPGRKTASQSLIQLLPV